MGSGCSQDVLGRDVDKSRNAARGAAMRIAAGRATARKAQVMEAIVLESTKWQPS